MTEQLKALAMKWRKDANTYMDQVQEARDKNLPHECMLGHATALREAVKALEKILDENKTDG